MDHIIRETQMYECEKCGEKVHNDVESWYEHEKFECGSDEFNGQAVKVDSYPGVAWRVVKTYARSYELVMVGDDRVQTFDIDDVHSIGENEFCSECGQIGCTHDGR